VYNSIPVMAMLRLATKDSGGRANLHAGGVGVGIDLSLGLTTSAVHQGQPIEILPGTRLDLSGLQLPEWQATLLLAVKTAQACGLNYVGVDIAADREEGPMVLEVNARPGLDIQYANASPLKSRLKRVEGLKVKTPEKAVRVAKSLFGLDIDEIEDTTGRTVVGIEEPVVIYDSADQPHTIKAKIDTGAYRTTIDQRLAQDWHIDNPVVDYKGVRGALGEQTRPIVNLVLEVRDHRIKTQAFLADRSQMKYDMIIGRRDLKGFLVDPNKRLTPLPN